MINNGVDILQHKYLKNLTAVNMPKKRQIDLICLKKYHHFCTYILKYFLGSHLSVLGSLHPLKQQKILVLYAVTLMFFTVILLTS